MVRCLIVDDEPLALDVLKRYIAATPGLSLAGEFTRPMDAFAFLQRDTVDLLFIDIQMPGLTGMELIRSLQQPPQVVFTTAYREFAAEGFELQALDYLVKPIARDRFLKTIDRFYARLRGVANVETTPDESRPFIFIKVDKAMVKIWLDDIFFVEALKNYVRIKTPGKDIISYHTLSYMEDKLPSHLFQRIHKSFLVNLSKIDKYTSDSVEVAAKQLPIGKTYQEALNASLQKRAI